MATKKQKEFAQLVGDGSQPVEAYRKVYDSSGNPNTQRVEASRLKANPNVAPLIEAREAENVRNTARGARSRAAWVIRRLESEASDPENPPGVRVRALDTLGKASGIFDAQADREVKRKTATPSELLAELTARLQEHSISLGAIDIDSITEVNSETAETIPYPVGQELEDCSDAENTEPESFCSDDENT